MTGQSDIKHPVFRKQPITYQCSFCFHFQMKLSESFSVSVTLTSAITDPDPAVYILEKVKFENFSNLYLSQGD